MKPVLGLLTTLIFTTSAFSSSKENNDKNKTFFDDSIPCEMIIKISSLLDDKDIAQITKVNKRCNYIFSRDNSEAKRNSRKLLRKNLQSPPFDKIVVPPRELGGFAKEGELGGILRENSRFAVTDHAGHIFFLEEFLSLPGRPSIAKVKNINLLAKEKPDDFIRLVLKTIPHDPENIQNNLKSFYKETMKIDDLIADLPVYETSREKLAVLLFDLLGYFDLMDQASDQILLQIQFAENRFRTQFIAHLIALFYTQYLVNVSSLVMAPIASQVHVQIFTQICLQIFLRYMEQVVCTLSETQLRHEIRHQIWDHIWLRLRIQIRLGLRESGGGAVWQKVKTQVSNLSRSELWENLPFFNFTQAYQNGELIETIKSSADGIFMLHQLYTIALSNSKQFRAIIDKPGGILQSIEDNLSEDEARNILDSIDLTDVSESKYLNKIQLDILRKRLAYQS